MGDDRYTITGAIARGGMAEVFRGVSSSIHGLKKNVAIKRILPSLANNEKFVAMFLDEARLSLHLQHANIVGVFDIGKSGNSYFLVMEFVNGCDLKALIQRYVASQTRMQIGHAIYIAIEACKGLAYAHDLEHPETDEPLHIVHRDISPANILMSRMGEVKLVDFGLAKANSQLEETDQGVVKGKFSYLCPEATMGMQVDHRADIFAIGILLWEMFTGQRLFYGNTDLETIGLVRAARIPSIGAINTSVDMELEQIVKKALAQDPEHRYQHAADLGDVLSQYLFGRGIKVTARDIASQVRQVQGTEKAAKKQNSLVNQLIAEEVNALTSVIGDEQPGEQAADASQAPVDQGDLVDTSSWLDDFGLDLDLGDKPAAAKPPAPMAKGSGQTSAAKPPAPPPPVPNQTANPAQDIPLLDDDIVMLDDSEIETLD